MLTPKVYTVAPNFLPSNFDNGRHRLFATDLSCLELPAAQAVGLAVDPADGKLEGEECALDIVLLEVALVTDQTDPFCEWCSLDTPFETMLETFLWNFFGISLV